MRLIAARLCTALLAAMLVGSCAACRRQEEPEATAPALPTHAQATASPTAAPSPYRDGQADSTAFFPDYAGLVRECFLSVRGDVQFGIHMYQNGYQYQTESKQMVSASVIKLFIMEYAFSQIEDGVLSMDDTMGGRSLRSLLEAMITWSDNDAANTLIDRFTMEKLNAFFSAQGYHDTKIERRMLDTAAQAQGLENYTSVRDVMAFLDSLYEKQDRSPYSDMLAIMKRQQISTKLRRDLPAGTVIANKTGELADVENDAGFVFTEQGDFALVILTNDVPNPAAARDAIAQSARRLYDQLTDGG